MGITNRSLLKRRASDGCVTGMSFFAVALQDACIDFLEALFGFDTVLVFGIGRSGDSVGSIPTARLLKQHELDVLFGGIAYEPERYAINPPEVVEDATPLERAVFTDMYGERVETPIVGFDVPTYLISYGRDAGSDRTENPAQLAAGVVSTPTGASGSNALGSMPFEELLMADEGAAFRRAVGLPEDPTFVQPPVHLESEEGTALDSETETQAFLVAIEGQNARPQGATRQTSDVGIGVATVYTMRVTVNDTAVLLGLVNGAGLPAGRTPAPDSVDPEDMQRVAELLGQLNRMTLMWKALSALGRPARGVGRGFVRGRRHTLHSSQARCLRPRARGRSRRAILRV